MPAGKVDDRKAPKPETDWTGEEVPFVIRSAMGHRRSHAFDRLALNGRATLKVKLSGDAAHNQILGGGRKGVAARSVFGEVKREAAEHL
jgi:hypothetical protein